MKRRAAFAFVMALVLVVGAVGADPTFGAGENTLLFEDTFDDGDIDEYTLGCSDLQVGEDCTAEVVGTEDGNALNLFSETRDGSEVTSNLDTDANFTWDQNQSIVIQYRANYSGRTRGAGSQSRIRGGMSLVDAATDTVLVRMQLEYIVGRDTPEWKISGSAIDGTVTETHADDSLGGQFITIPMTNVTVDIDYGGGIARIDAGESSFTAPLVENAIADDTNVSVRWRTHAFDAASDDPARMRMHALEGSVQGGEVEQFGGQSFVSGFVKDEQGDVIEGASITTNDSATDTTGADGKYNISLDDGDWLISAEAPNGDTGSIAVNVSGSDLDNQNITTAALTLDVKTFMEHGSTQSYTVRLGTTDVTDEATVTSGDSAVISVDESAQTLAATSDESVNQQVTISATHEGTTVTEDVTVANKTLDNIAILPPATWPIAIIGQPGDTTGASGTWPGAIQLQWLFVAMAVGAIVSWASANPFMGLGSVEMLLAFGWVINWISDGMLIASIIFLVYASLSLTDIASGNLGHR